MTSLGISDIAEPIPEGITQSVTKDLKFKLSLYLMRRHEQKLQNKIAQSFGSKVALGIVLKSKKEEVVDLAIYHLSAAGFGPKLLVTFRNGMVQSFIHTRTLDVSESETVKKNINSGFSASTDQNSVLMNDIFLKLPQPDLQNLCTLLGHEGHSDKV